MLRPLRSRRPRRRPTSATRISPRSSMRDRPNARARAPRAAGITSRHASPASQSCVTCFVDVVHAGPSVSGCSSARRHRGGRARAAGARSVARARAARGRRRPRRRDRRATTSVPACASRAAISQPSSAPSLGAQPEVERARPAVVHEPVRAERVEPRACGAPRSAPAARRRARRRRARPRPRPASGWGP